MEVVLIWKLSLSTRAWHSIRFSTQAALHALFIQVLIGLCSYKNVVAIWGHSRWKLTLNQIVSLRAFSFVLTAISNSQEGCRCTLVPRLPFPVPRSPFPVPCSPFSVSGISNIPRKGKMKILRPWNCKKRKCKSLYLIIQVNFSIFFQYLSNISSQNFAWLDFVFLYTCNWNLVLLYFLFAIKPSRICKTLLLWNNKIGNIQYFVSI